MLIFRKPISMICAILAVGAAFQASADEEIPYDELPEQQAGQAGVEIAQERSVRTEWNQNEDGMDDQVLGITPQAGFVSLSDSVDDGNARAVAGIIFDGNFLAGLKTGAGSPFFGPSFGILYSHLGRPGSNFFGLNSPSGDGGGDLVLLPANLKLGFTFGEAVRLAAHGGVNIHYQRSGGQVSAGPVTASFEDEDWNVNPNIGADLEIGLGKDVTFLVRPDWTFRSGSDLFTGTLGIGFPITQ